MEKHSLSLATRLPVIWLAQAAAFGPAAIAGNFPAEIEVDLLRESAGNDGSAGFSLSRAATDNFARLGRYLATVGDLNNDGLADFAVSDGGSADRAYVVFGNSDGFPGTFSLDSLDPANGGDGSAGFVLIDTDRVRVAGAGDVNDDGVDDMLWSSDTLAEAYVLYGQTSGFPATISPDELRAANGGDGTLGSVLLVAGETELRLGDNIAGAGDMNGDGIADLILRAGAGGDCNFSASFCSGEIFLVYGVNGGFGAGFDLGALRPAGGGDGTDGRVLIGAARTNVTSPDAAAVAGIDDVNNDGLDDIIIGAPEAGIQAPAGRAFVVFGDANGSAELPLADLLAENGGDGSAGFAINGEAMEDLSLIDAAAAGDVNGDSIPDFVVGAALASPGDEADAGNAYLLLGRNGNFGTEVDLAALRAGDGSTGSVFETGMASDGTGYTVGSAGDLNADGIDDLIVAARRGGVSEAGSVFVLYGDLAGFGPLVDLTALLAANGGNGSTGSVFQASSADAFDEVQATGVGDVNGDGIDDLAISANRARGPDEGFDDNGEAYVIFGRLPAALNTQIIGLNLSLGACRNVASGQTVSVGLPEFALDESFDCTALGLQFAPGEQVLLQGEGTNFGTALNGSAVGLADGGNVTCRREDTLEEVTVDIAEGGTWDCEAAGFAVPNQVAVTVTIRGSAEPLFESPERISLTLDGMDTRTAACQNLTDPQTVTAVLADVRLSETIDCETLGLTASPGDTISIQGRGRNFGPGLSGSFQQLATDVIVRCENNNLGEVEFITPAPGQTDFDCAATGLTLRNQDTVTVTLRGALAAEE